MSDRAELTTELKQRLRPVLTRMRREQWLASLTGALRPAILIAAALAAWRAAAGEPSPLAIVTLSLLPVLWKAVWREKRLELPDAAAAIDRHADLKDRVITALANCDRAEWSSLVARQVQDAVIRLSSAAAPPVDRSYLPSLAVRVFLLAALFGLAWLWPLADTSSRGLNAAGEISSAAARQPIPLDAAALTSSYRLLRPAERLADPSFSARQPADATVARRYFEKLSPEKPPRP